MPKQYKISKIEYNQKMAGKYNGAFLHTVGVETDKPRKDFVFENSNIFKVLQECAVGDTVELRIVKSGDFWNLAKDDDAIVLVERGSSKKEEAKPEVTQKAEYKSYSGYKEDPDKQAAIIRQNALTNATNLIIANEAVGNIDKSIKLIITAAIQFAKFTSGEDMTEYLMEEPIAYSDPTTKPEVKRGRKPKDEPESKGEFGE
jgi:hypothetical protein